VYIYENITVYNVKQHFFLPQVGAETSKVPSSWQISGFVPVTVKPGLHVNESCASTANITSVSTTAPFAGAGRVEHMVASVIASVR
jgi:hypothetical protein